MKYLSILLAAGVVSAGSLVFAGPVDLSKLPPPSTQQGVTYDKDIHPIFEASSCFRCHGPPRPKAGLRLDSLEGVLKGSKDGKVVKPGNSEKSQIVIAVARLDPESAMPPKPKPGRKRGPEGMGMSTNAPAEHAEHGEMGEAGGPGGPGGPGQKGPPPKPLTPEQVGLVRAWIDQGAK
jgi:hypothetical protein